MKKSESRFVPAKGCLICDRDNSRPQDKMIYARKTWLVSVIPKEEKRGENDTRYYDLLNPDFVLKVRGEFLKLEDIQKAITFANSGFRSWVCNRCVGFECEKCGASTYPQGVDIINDDGSTGHVMAFGGQVPCECNPKPRS